VKLFVVSATVCCRWFSPADRRGTEPFEFGERRSSSLRDGVVARLLGGRDSTGESRFAVRLDELRGAREPRQCGLGLVDDGFRRRRWLGPSIRGWPVRSSRRCRPGDETSESGGDGVGVGHAVDGPVFLLECSAARRAEGWTGAASARFRVTRSLLRHCRLQLAMTDTVDDVELPYDEAASQQEKIESLRDRLEVLEAQNEEMRDSLLDANAENNKFQQKLERLTHENKKLKQSPLFVATVQELNDDGVVIKQHGNNQEALTEVTDEMREELEPDDRVAVNNSLSVVKQLTRETDVRARVMQIEHSPDVTYEDIGGLDDQMREVRETVELPLEQPEAFDTVGIQPPSGVLLHGPPGTGKTMLAKAVARETNASFIKMAGSELVHKFIGEGAKLVRDLFEVARDNEPAVIFIDEIDAIASKRTDSKTSGDAEVQRTMMQLLSEMDGFDERGDIRIIAATNRFDMLDEAILRPGRFDRLIEVPKPDAEGRELIFGIHTRDMNVADDVDFAALAEMAADASGADIKAICTEAGMFAIRDDRKEIAMQDFEDAWEKIQTSETTEVAESAAFA
jgi:proteasome regulatory subunit